MEASELRIGNWVNFCQVGDEFAQIDGLNIYSFSKSPDLMRSVIKPIPLTEDWLLKFGLEILSSDVEGNETTTIFHLPVERYSKDPDAMIEVVSVKSKLHKDDDWMSLRYWSDDVNSGEEVCVYLPGFIKYVHELQNLCFALSKDELIVK